jgi:hypothetical protein
MSGLRSVVSAIKAGRPVSLDASLNDLLAEVASQEKEEPENIEDWARHMAESVGDLAD